MRWIIGLLDFRFWNGDAGGSGGGGPGTDAGADREPEQFGEFMLNGVPTRYVYHGGQYFPEAVPQTTPAAAPAAPAAPDFAANKQTANIDRTSQYSHGNYTKALEGIYEKSRGSGADAGMGANDYELPDAAFGERLY